MPSSRLAKVVAAMAMAPLVTNAHMIMKTPAPYGNPSKSPLDASGSNFPCQSVAYTGTSNQWAVGSTQTLSWQDDNTAVHGGGSCQISVTKDKNPTKNSVWKVIHSIEGGCPANVPANLVAPEKLATFPFTIPASLPNGEMSMAWTWFNRIGNREMYMNCAPITVTGGASDDSAFTALPDMAIANINVGTGATCATKENFNYIFANPGMSVTNGDPSGTYQTCALCNGAAAAPPSGPPAGAPSAPAPAASKPPVASKSPVASGAPYSTMKTVPAGPAQTGAVPNKNPPTASKAPLSAPAASKPTAPAQNPSGNNSYPGTSTGTQCDKDGAVVCQGTDKFAICDRGVAFFMPVADGTTCSNGVIVKRNAHMHRHLRRSF